MIIDFPQNPHLLDQSNDTITGVGLNSVNLHNITRQEVILRRIFDDGSIQNRIISVLDPELFSSVNQNICRSIRSYHKKYSRFPDPQEVMVSFPDDAPERNQLIKIMGYPMESIKRDVAIDIIERFFRESMTESILMRAAHEISKQKVDKIADLVIALQHSVNFTITTDTGLSAIADMHEIIKRLNETHTAIPSAIDDIRGYTGRKNAGGGWYRSGLAVLMGMPNIGKTIFMCNEAAYAYQSGYNVLYITLEMGAELIHERIISNVTDIDMSDVRSSDPDMILDKYKTSTHDGVIKHGELFVKQLPTTTTVTEIENVINEIKLTHGIQVDILFVDYLGIMKPMRRDNTIQQLNMYTMGKEVAEQLRDMAILYEIPVVTASQMNRDGYESTQASMKHTAGSAGVNDTADFIITITQDPLLKSNKMFLHTIIKNRYGENMVSFLTQCDYTKMRVRTALQVDVQAYNDAMMSQNTPVEGFNGTKGPSYNTSPIVKSESEIKAQDELMSRFRDIELQASKILDEQSDDIYSDSSNNTPVINNIHELPQNPVMDGFPTNPFIQQSNVTQSQSTPMTTSTNVQNSGVILPNTGDIYGI